MLCISMAYNVISCKIINQKQNNWVQSVLRKHSLFRQFAWPSCKKIRRSRACSILMPHSQFEPLYLKDFRGTTPKVDLVSTIWGPAPQNARISQKLSNILGHFDVILHSFPSQKVNFCLQHVIHIWQAYGSATNLSYPGISCDASDFWQHKHSWTCELGLVLCPR